jgi:hypothetical protein
MALIIPNNIQNGDIEDADEVMGNFDYIAAHAPTAPASATVNHLAAFNATDGLSLIDAGIAISDVVANPAAGSQITAAIVTGTTDTTGVMMGLAGSITPTRSGKVAIMASFEMLNTADDPVAGLRYGTGSAPANGDALIGTAASALIRATFADANEVIPASCVAYVTGLTLNTAYWLDLSLQSIAGGSVSVQSVTLIAVEQ